MPGQKNVPGIATIQHPLGDIDSGSCHIGFIVNVFDSTDRTTVNAHPQLNARIISQSSGDLQCASRRLFRTMKKQECHSVSGRYAQEFAACFRRPETFCASHNLIQFLKQLDLLIDEQFRITDDVD
jgi:hypothetical protein